MLLRTAAASASSLSLFSPNAEPPRSVPARGLVVRAAKGSTNHRALTGESSEEEREHAEKLMEYQNKRGGKVKLQSIVMPLSDFDHADKGDALHAMELALSLEKLTNEKLLNLHSVATKNGDVQLADFVETEYLGEQVEAIKRISEYVAQLRRVGKGHVSKEQWLVWGSLVEHRISETVLDMEVTNVAFKKIK
ncbi:hypothetical protein JHK86_039070 [Glycine max]|nr:hypothetical protein JHK86_039070 [Glycine max]